MFLVPHLSKKIAMTSSPRSLPAWALADSTVWADARSGQGAKHLRHQQETKTWDLLLLWPMNLNHTTNMVECLQKIAEIVLPLKHVTPVFSKVISSLHTRNCLLSCWHTLWSRKSNWAKPRVSFLCSWDTPVGLKITVRGNPWFYRITDLERESKRVIISMHLIDKVSWVLFIDYVKLLGMRRHLKLRGHNSESSTNSQLLKNVYFLCTEKDWIW